MAKSYSNAKASTATGTVTSVSSANGAITVATGTTTPLLTAVYAPALKSATTTVDVSAATAPSAGQVLTAVDSTHATWQAAGGGNTGTGIILLSSTTVNLNDGTHAKQTLYTVPANKRAIVVGWIMQKFSAGVTVPTTISAGWNASANDVIDQVAFDDTINAVPAGGMTNFAIYQGTFSGSPMLPVPAVGAAGDILGFKCVTAAGSALTAICDVFGYLTATNGTPSANINVP